MYSQNQNLEKRHNLESFYNFIVFFYKLQIAENMKNALTGIIEQILQEQKKLKLITGKKKN